MIREDSLLCINVLLFEENFQFLRLNEVILLVHILVDPLALSFEEEDLIFEGLYFHRVSKTDRCYLDRAHSFTNLKKVQRLGLFLMIEEGEAVRGQTFSYSEQYHWDNGVEIKFHGFFACLLANDLVLSLQD